MNRIASTTRRPLRALRLLALTGLCLGSLGLRAETVIAERNVDFGLGQTTLRVVADTEAAKASAQINTLLSSAREDMQHLLQADLRLAPAQLEPLANYLSLLFPELDLGAPVSLRAVTLNEAQAGKLFNLYFDLLDQASQGDSERVAYLNSVDFSSGHFLARRFTELAREQGQCLSASARGDRAAAPAEIVLAVAEDPASCDVEASARTIWINRLVMATDVEGVSELDTDSLSAALELQRRKVMGYADYGVGGFEVVELLGLVQAIGELYRSSAGGSRLDSPAMGPLMLQLDKLRRPRGVSFEELRSAADVIQAEYRREGYFLAKVFVPEQDFQRATGEVELQVSYGILGDVVLRNSDAMHYDEDVILDPFRVFLGHEVTRDIYSAYFDVNDLPGLTIRSGLFEPGDAAGETRLVLDVKEQPLNLRLAMDNYGSEFTGEQRYLALLDWHSPLGRGDSLSLGALQSTSPSNSTYGFVNYRLPVWNINHVVSASWDAQSYESIDARTGTRVLIVGDVNTATLGYDYKIRRSKELNLQAGLRAYEKSSDVEVSLPLEGDVQVNEQSTEVRGGLLLANGDVLLRRMRAIIAWQGSLLYGERRGEYDTRLPQNYYKTALDLEASALLPSGRHLNYLSARISSSYSDDVLPSFEQVPLGGPYGVRAFNVYDFTADSLIYTSLQWQLDLGRYLGGSFSSQHELRGGAFIEGAYGRINGVGQADNSWASLAGYGLALEYSWRRKLDLEAVWAWPAHDDSSEDFESEISADSSRILFNVRYALF